MTEAYLVDGVRTPIGRYAGALAAVRPDDLAAHVLRELLARHPQVEPGAVDEVALGCANQAGEDNRDVARTVRTGEADLVVAGGVESMSRAPFVIPKAQSPYDRSAGQVFDTTIRPPRRCSHAWASP